MIRSAALVAVLASLLTLPVSADCGPSLAGGSSALSGKVVSVPVSVFYYRGWGGAIGPKIAVANGVTLAPQVMYGQIGGTNGVTGFRAGCHEYEVPFTSSAVHQWGLMLTVEIPVRGRAAP